MSPIRVISPADHVRQHLAMYWKGNPSPGFDDVNAALSDQLKEDGCREIVVLSKCDWQCVCCEIGWVKSVSAQFGSVGRLFEDAVVISGPIAGGLRVEWLVAILAASVRVWVDGQIAYSQDAPVTVFDPFTADELQGRVCIAYSIYGQSVSAALG